jgi:hypothetical protein
MKTKHGEEKKRIRNDTASDKDQLMKKIKTINKEHRAGVTEHKSQIRDFKAVKISLTITEFSLAKTQHDQKGIIDNLNNDICCIKQEKAKLSGLVTALTNEKESALPKLDELVALKLKWQQICAKLALEKDKVALQRTIQTKSNGTKNQETTLQHKQQICVFKAELKVKSHKRTLEIKEEIRQKKLLEQRSQYVNVSNAMSQISPFQNSAFHSNNAGASRGDIRNGMVVQNGGTFPNTRVATTACVTEVSFKNFGCLCLRLQNIVPNNSFILYIWSFVVFWMMIRIRHDDKEIKNLGNRPSRNNAPGGAWTTRHWRAGGSATKRMGLPFRSTFRRGIFFLSRDGRSCLFTRRSVSEKAFHQFNFLCVQFLRQHGQAVVSPLLLVTGPTAALEPAPTPGKSADLILWNLPL